MLLVGEYEAGLKARYREGRARMRPPPVVRAVKVPKPAPPSTVPVGLLGTCSWRTILTLVALRYGIAEESLLGWSRVAPLRDARHDAIALIYTHTGLSTTQVGQIFSGRDHTTVLHSLAVRGLGTMAKVEARRARGRLHPRDVKSTYYFPPELRK